MTNKNLKKLSASLNDLVDDADNKPLPFNDVLEKLKGKGAPVFLIILTIPLCLPVAIPGSSTVIGLIISFIGLRMAIGKQPYWPEFIKEKEISYKWLKKIVKFTDKSFKLGKKFLDSRLSWISDSTPLQRMHGLLVVVLGILLAIPVPIPFTNYLSTVPLIFLGLGFLEDDGLFILLAYIMTVFSLAFWGFFFIYGAEGIKALF